MKCVICNSPDIEEKELEEEIKVGEDVLLVPLKVMVCLGCGERYYTRKTMKIIEEIEEKVKNKEIPLHAVGRVLKPSPSLL